jgi:hypothetical protein
MSFCGNGLIKPSFQKVWNKCMSGYERKIGVNLAILFLFDHLNLYYSILWIYGIYVGETFLF